MDLSDRDGRNVPAGARLRGADGGVVHWFQDFNARLWPQRIGVDVDGTIGTNDTDRLFQLNCTGCENNGNITAVSRQSRPSPLGNLSMMSFTYRYDNLNRLDHCAFSEGVPEYSYDYAMDRYGNLLGRAAGGAYSGVPKSLSQSVDPSTNRLNESADVQYDVLGNQVKMVNPVGDTLLFSYMDQGHILQVKDAAGTVKYRYYYDAAGKRRIKLKGDESAGIADNVTYSFYEGENLICQQDRGDQIQPDEAYTPKFLLLDHLGSTRAELNFGVDGTAAIGQLTDLMPYGEEIAPPLMESEAVKFTGKQRDEESGLDEFGARKFKSNLCRWLSPDVLMTKKRIGSSKKWNLYSYCVDNPIRFADPSGLWQVAQIVDTDKNGEKTVHLRIVESPGDNSAAGLAKQLGFGGNKKLIAKIEGMLEKDNSGIDGKDLPGIIGRTFRVAEKGLSAQANYSGGPDDPKGPPVPGMADCSMTAAQIAFPSAMRGVYMRGQWGVAQMDSMIASSRLGQVREGDERTGDIVRWGELGSRHFANVIFINDDGSPQVFTRSGDQGEFSIRDINWDYFAFYGSTYDMYRPTE